MCSSKEEPREGSGQGELLEVADQAVLLALPGPLAFSSLGASLTPRLSSGDRDVDCPQGSAPCTETPGSWGSPASSLEPSSPESEGRGPGPQPSPVSSGEGSPQLRSHQPGSELPKWALDASSPSLLETDGAEPHSLETEEAGGTLNLGKEVKSEGPARTAEAGAVQPDVRLTSPEG